MAKIRIKVAGIEVECESASDAKAMLRELRESAVEPTPSSQIRAGNGSIRRPFRPSRITLAVINALREREEWPASELADALGLSHPKGLGNVAGRINRDLEPCGIDPADLYVSTRREDGVRVWRRGPRFEQLSMAQEE